MSVEITNTPVEEARPARFTRQNRWADLGLKLLGWLRRLLTVRNLIVFSVASAFTVILFIFINYFTQLVFTKPLQLVDGGLAHAYFISKFVKDMPAFKPLENSQTYYSNFLGDASIPVNIMRYESNAPPEEIISYYRLYFEILNYTYVKHPFDSKALAMFHNTREGFTVFVHAGENVNTVSIENYKYD
jgi:hypothetical protein